MALAYIFPGQGSQYPGMGKDLAENFPRRDRSLKKRTRRSGFRFRDLCFEGPAEELQLTENTQPAILTRFGCGASGDGGEGFPAAGFCRRAQSGRIFGAGRRRRVDVWPMRCRTVRARGRYMQEAVPVGTGAMAAVIGADLTDIETACAEAQQGQVCAPANINSPSQVVIAGNTEAVDRAIELLKERGAKRVMKLNVSAPFHCALMMPAQERLAADLEAT